MRGKTTRISRRGDTIVEVLIAIAIVSTVIAGAFTVTQKSTQAVRTSQERGEMLQLMQGKVETLRSLALRADPADDIYAATPKYFCIDDSGAYKPIGASGFGTCQFGTDNRYNISITYDSTSKVFTFLGEWDGLSGARQQAKLVYRIEPGLAITAPGNVAPGPPPPITCSTFAGNLFPNGDFSTPAGNGPFIDTAAGFTSDIPNRGPGVWPDDDGLRGLAGYRGGISIQTGDSVIDISTPGFPNTFLRGFYFRGDLADDVGEAQNYFYSNPHQALSEGINPPRRFGSNGFKGTIWRATVRPAPSGPLEPNTTYEFRAYFDNLLSPTKVTDADPEIEFWIDGVRAFGPATITKSARTAAGAWQPTNRLRTIFTTGATVSDMVFEVKDQSGQINGDDFAMTALNLRKCTT